MSIPPNVGPNVALILRRLDLIEKKIDWVAERVTWLTYTAGSPEQAQGDRSTTTDSSPTTHAPMAAAESINVLDHRASEPLPTTTSPAAATTTPAGTSATSAATELPTRLLSDSPAQAADEELPQHEVVSASAPAVLHDDAPRVPEVEEPVVQAPRPPAPISPEHSSESWASPGSTGYTPAPSQRADTSDPYQEAPVGADHSSGAEATEIPGWARRAVREGNLGRYLLSGAAALLVLSAGVSLLALVWDSIPNPVKILALAFIAVTMTAVGARLSVSRPKYRVAAATITGTGGGLGFVSIVGAVLLGGMLGPEPALVLMAGWGLVLLVVSHLTRVLFTAIISTIGALVTIGFAFSHVTHQASTAIVTWLMISVYVTVLALTCAALSRGTGRMRLAAWYPATSVAATVASLVFAPISPMLRVSVVGGTGIVLALCLLLVGQVMHAGRRLWSIGIKTAGWDWGLTALVLLMVHPNLLMKQISLEVVHSAVVATFILQLLLLAGAALAVLAPRNPDQWRSAMAISHEVTFFPLALAAMATVSDPRVYLFVVVAAMLCFLPAIVDGRAEPAPILALLGTAPILVPPTTTYYARADRLSLIASVAVSVLLVMMTEGLEDRTARSMPSPALSGASSRVQSRLLALRAALAAIVFNLAVLIPSLAKVLVNDSLSARAVLHMVPGLVLIAFIALGAVSSEATPLRVLSGQCRGSRYRVDPQGQALPDPNSSLTGAPVPSWIVSGLAAVTAVATLSWAEELSSTTWAVALAAVALGLGACATWLLLPWGRRAEVCLSLAIGNSLLMWLSVIVVTSIAVGSVLMSVLVLLTGGACIVVGFRLRLTVLRHYGLTLVLLSVLKLAAVDTASQNSIIRVVSLAAAGIICFVLSLIYNRYAQEQRREQMSGAQERSQA
ncbi:DUF2339 domain-containing protein [Actinomyces naeslundii]|uniref:DUF2339 domain-containing protein n=1 Tax=Actinomyces naeslundii TaxID=1655 RepID=UPI00096CD8AE|nr:DUF2339 domain-containing protein [Actinomyces naeslundii]OMG13761.1 DUF2339 domain-containing protein [Actinomyces naeslundii]